QIPAWEIIPFRENKKVAFKATKKYGGKTLKFKLYNPVEEFLKIGMYTHSQRVYLAWRILKDRPHITECISRRFPEIIVDEAQDTNIWLLILLNLLRSKGTKITLVGDPDQCIYEFSMAHATSLEKLKNHWEIPEKPLNQSFRCNNTIAASVRNISGNISFVGCGQNENVHHRPFVMREPSTGLVQFIPAFQKLLIQAGIKQSNSAIICRAHQEIESIRGEANYSNLKGRTKEMSVAAFHRDVRKDYKKAHQIVEKEIRAIVQDPDFWESLDEEPESKSSRRVRLALWKFVKSPDGLPSVSKNGTDWIENLRENLLKLLADIGIANIPKIGGIFKRTGLNANQLTSPLFAPQTLFPPIRQETIHQVKGESIDGVLVLGSAKFFNAAVKAIESNENTEERRLAYVAMTRARKTLLVGLPASHFDKHISSWERWGFSILESKS
ncbi:MAG: UvrD-helicase domain-containing protein, partial [Candidatus Ranarchaeia archaeon]